MAVTATLNGFMKEDLVSKEPTVLDFSFFTGGCWSCFKYFCLPPCSENCITTFRNMMKYTKEDVKLEDAREKQRSEGLTNLQFFDKYGFVLLDHKTEMSAEDWLEASFVPGPNSSGLKKDPSAPDSAVRSIYAKELEPILQELIPRSEGIYFPNKALRRGPKGPNPLYGFGVHQDFGLYPEEMTNNFISHEDTFEAWLERLKASGGYSIINFWRPILPMQGPVKDTPLALCDPNSVEMDAVVPQLIHGFSKEGQKAMMMKYNKGQKWYYYPEMTKDEVLVFRQFHWDPSVSAPYNQLRTVYHSAFKHPDGKHEEARCSSEYRVGVWLKHGREGPRAS